MKIAVVAPSNTLSPDVEPLVRGFAAARYGDAAPDIVFHPQCLLAWGHFAGTDQAREDALVEAANDPRFDAVWCARGGYGSNRIAERAIARMTAAAREKYFIGFSDAGFLLAGLLRAGIGRPVHAPMPGNILSARGEESVGRTLDWLLAARDPGGRYLFGTFPPDTDPRRVAAFNLTVFSQVIGTPLQPDLSGRVLMLEEVGEAMYRIDRHMFHVTSNDNVRRCAGLMLGRCSDISTNTPDFGQTEEEVARHWCAVSGIRWLGRADIGHDADNKVVPFG